MRARIEAAIEKKVEGKEISVAETAPAGDGKVIDLMEALRASLQSTEGARAQVNRLGPRKAPKRAEEPARVAARRASVRPECASAGAQMPSYSVRDVERVLRLSPAPRAISSAPAS